MYLFCSDSSALLENRLLRVGARMFGTVKVIQSSGSCLIWVDTSSENPLLMGATTVQGT